MEFLAARCGGRSGAAQIRDTLSGVLYIGMFGIGSMLGMALLSAAISLPLRLAERWLAAANRVLQLGLASLTIFVGWSAIVHHL